MTNRPILNHTTQQLKEVQHGKLWMGDTFAINGLLHHDLYHLGQLGIVIKLLREGTAAPG